MNIPPHPATALRFPAASITMDPSNHRKHRRFHVARVTSIAEAVPSPRAGRHGDRRRPLPGPGLALGLGGATPPSDRIGMGFVGLGGQGGGHLFGGAWTYLPGGYLGRDDVQVLAVCDVQQARAEEGKARVERHYAERIGQGAYQGCGAYWDIRDMLLRDDIDAVLIAAAYHAAATNAILAVRAGKDVYCEKPTSVTIRAGRAVVDAVGPTVASIKPARSSGASTKAAFATPLSGPRRSHWPA